MPRTLASILALLTSLTPSAQAPPPRFVVYEGARLIDGRGRAPVENSAFVVEGGRISAVGRQGEIRPPAGATRVDLTGKTVMPAMINVHVDIGYEGYPVWGAAS